MDSQPGKYFHMYFCFQFDFWNFLLLLQSISQMYINECIMPQPLALTRYTLSDIHHNEIFSYGGGKNANPQLGFIDLFFLVIQ